MLAIAWQLSENHGWGISGVHIALYLLERGAPPIVLEKPLFSTMRPHIRKVLAALPPTWEHWQTVRAANSDRLLHFAGLDVVHALGNRTQRRKLILWGRRNFGVIAFDDTRMDSTSIALLREMDTVICHSRYNESLLRECGLRNVRMVWQGIDPTEMVLPPRHHRWGDRFVVFSGGKLEFRKGQDIVLVAFRRFQQHHPEALLVTAWHNLWPNIALTMAESPLVTAPPKVDGNIVQITSWAIENGVPAWSFIDLGFVARPMIAEIMAECHVAVFPNRCEGGTNLVAMEALACGVPTVVAANSGQLDLVEGAAICWPLTFQCPLADPEGCRRGWGECDPDELFEAMEVVYRNEAEVRHRGERARQVMLGQRTWRCFAENFIAACET